MLFWRPSPPTYCERHTLSHTAVVSSCHPRHVGRAACDLACSARWAQLGDRCRISELTRHQCGSPPTPSDKSVNSSLAPFAEWVSAGGIHVPKIRGAKRTAYVWMQHSGYCGQSSGLGFFNKCIELTRPPVPACVRLHYAHKKMHLSMTSLLE